MVMPVAETAQRETSGGVTTDQMPSSAELLEEHPHTLVLLDLQEDIAFPFQNEQSLSEIPVE